MLEWGLALGDCRHRLAIVCILLLNFCRISSPVSPSLGSSTPERCHPADVLINIENVGLSWPGASEQAAHLDKFVLRVAQGVLYQARLLLETPGVLVHEDWLQFHGAVQPHDQAQRISFVVPPLPAGRYTKHLQVFDACGLASSISALEEEDKRVRLLAGFNQVVDVEEAAGNWFSEQADRTAAETDPEPLGSKAVPHAGTGLRERELAGSENEHVMSEQLPVYVAGSATANTCGNDALISKESECKAAATALGKLPYHESGAWGNAPRGCLFDVRGAFYNTHATGGCSGSCGSLSMTPICVRRGAPILGPSHNTSQAGGSGDGQDTRDCRWAHQECMRPRSAKGVQARLTIRQPQDGATIYFTEDYKALLLQISYDFDDDCASFECAINGIKVIEGHLCNFAVKEWAIPWKYDLMLLSLGKSMPMRIECKANPSKFSGSVMWIRDTADVTLSPMPAETGSQQTLLGILKARQEEFKHDATLWQGAYLNTVQSRGWIHGAIRIPTTEAQLAYLEVLPYKAMRQRRYQAYVVHVPAHTKRWDAIVENFASVSDFIQVRKWTAFPLDHRKVQEGLGAGGGGGAQTSGRLLAFKSLTLSMKAAWEAWGKGGGGIAGWPPSKEKEGLFRETARNGRGERGEAVEEEEEAMPEAEQWAFFLEDDVDWHPAIKDKPQAIAAALSRGLEVAQKEGFAMLGWCEAKLGNFDHWYSDDVVVRRGNGMCAHALAMTRWRAATMAAELDIFRTNSAEDVHIDVLLREWIRKGEGSHFGTGGGGYLLGANLTIQSGPPGDSEIAKMVGLLFQDRVRHVSHTRMSPVTRWREMRLGNKTEFR
jgi:hypothetical protein